MSIDLKLNGQPIRNQLNTNLIFLKLEQSICLEIGFKFVSCIPNENGNGWRCYLQPASSSENQSVNIIKEYEDQLLELFRESDIANMDLVSLYQNKSVSLEILKKHWVSSIDKDGDILVHLKDPNNMATKRIYLTGIWILNKSHLFGCFLDLR